MKSSLLVNFSVDKENKQINVEREFAAPISKVWAAWTVSSILDQWWAPKPWKAKTKSMDFKEGGTWLYAMLGPEGEEHWARADFTTISPMKSFSLNDTFCDSEGNINTAMPKSNWTNEFTENDNSTTVFIKLQFDDLADLQANIDMGFKEGFLSGLGNLDELLA